MKKEAVKCISCNSKRTIQAGVRLGTQRYFCKDCKKKFQVKRKYFKSSDCLRGFISRLKKEDFSVRQIKEFCKNGLKKKVSHGFIVQTRQEESVLRTCFQKNCVFCLITDEDIKNYFWDVKEEAKYENPRTDCLECGSGKVEVIESEVESSKFLKFLDLWKSKKQGSYEEKVKSRWSFPVTVEVKKLFASAKTIDELRKKIDDEKKCQAEQSYMMQENVILYHCKTCHSINISNFSEGLTDLISPKQYREVLIRQLSKRDGIPMQELKKWFNTPLTSL